MSIILKYLITFFVGMVPILELRGAIPIGVGLGLSYFEAFICSFIGNIVPIYFIVKYIRPLFDFFGRWKPFKVIIDWATERATRKIEESENVALAENYDYYAVPSLFIGKEKCFECTIQDDYDSIKANFKRVFDEALK